MRYRKRLIGAALAALATAATGAAFAQSDTVNPGDPPGSSRPDGAPGPRGDGPHRGHGGPGGPDGAHGHGRHHRNDPAQFERRMEQRISRMVTQVGGTTEQRDRIVAIMKTAMADQAKLREQGRELRGQQRALLTAPTIDRAALEAQRAKRQALFDQMSRRMTAAMVDAAEVLTPEQRVKFAEMAEQRRGRGRDHGMGPGMGGPGMGGPGMGPGMGPDRGPAGPAGGPGGPGSPRG